MTNRGYSILNHLRTLDNLHDWRYCHRTMGGFVAMTPVHCNCLYFNERKRTCHNPDSPYYHGHHKEELPFVGKCDHWEHWREFIDEEKRRLKHGKKR